MKTNIQKLLVGASLAVGVSAIATNPASAASLTNPMVTGEKGEDYLIYEHVPNPDPEATTDFTRLNNDADLETVLQGSCSVGGAFIPSNSCNKGEPGGNVELFANSERLSLDEFLNYDTTTSLMGDLGDKSITLSSLTATDWFGETLDTSYNYNGDNLNLANEWFEAALTSYGITDDLLRTANMFMPTIPNSKESLFNEFRDNGGFQRFSDPNIAYVEMDDMTGSLEVGLAGHYDAVDLIFDDLTDQQKGMLSMVWGDRPVQAAELVKITYDGETTYHYSFSAAASGLLEQGDMMSHTGLYDPELTSNVEVEKAPEPSFVLGSLLAAGGMFAAKRKQKK
ncbi:MAG: NF038130 family PEP-CTERM protein [Coleofasciculus sp. B1-GNL1-01]|uniref:NF038130 family PEP-CTERM protein n=1 Tax=Coleofasciculus sp. B1-GNL1-01 TaxID=3068484 RepID=UPI0032F605B2